jgi:hypothetical protein
MKQSNESASDSVLKWLQKLSRHFNAELSEDQLEIFTHALRNNTRYQIDEAFDRCLNECQFMPKLADVHQRMPEPKYAPENPGRFVLNGPPIIDLVRDVARELYPNLDSLEGSELHEAFAIANRERYRRMGINPDRWQGRAKA